VFGRADIDRLATQLAAMKGKFLLSISDTPGLRTTFATFHMIEADKTYTVGAGAAVKVAEPIIANFDPRCRRPVPALRGDWLAGGRLA